MAVISENFKKKLIAARFDDILGQEKVKESLKSTLLVGRHVILLGPPGVGKTTIAKSVSTLLDEAHVMDCSYHCDPAKPICPECLTGKTKGKKTIKGTERFVRAQGSPDLTAEDLLGDIDPIKALKYGPLSIEAFTPGKIFKANNGILFFDELNRAPEKLQNALLQVLSEGKVTIGSYDVDLETDFLFIATMNPEDSSTETLSEVMLDRFDMVKMGYPESMEIEQQIVTSKGKNLVDMPKPVLNAIVHYVRSMRVDPNLEKVPSVRGTLGLYERSQAQAILKGKKQVSIEDVRDVVDSVIAHRIRLKPSMRMVKNVKEYTKERFEQEAAKFKEAQSSSDQSEDPETDEDL